MNELNIEASPAMRKTVKLYAKFFDSKERIERLKRIGREYHTPLQLHIDIMAVLAGLNGGSAQDVFIAVLSAGQDEENNAVLSNIKKFGNIDAFWQLVRKYTGFIHEDGKTLDLFSAHVLLTALAQTMNPSVLKGLERFISDSNKAYCYSIVHEWRNREDNGALWELCRSVEQELHLASRFEKQDIETLLTADIFPSIHEVILSRFFSEIADHVVKTELMLKTAENRRTSGWIERFNNYYDCLYYIAKMQSFSFNENEDDELIIPDDSSENIVGETSPECTSKSGSDPIEKHDPYAADDFHVYVYCLVKLDGTNTIKFYRTEDRTLKRGEAVFVPDESSGSKLRGTICSIEHHMSFSIPKPVEETPEIIGRA